MDETNAGSGDGDGAQQEDPQYSPTAIIVLVVLAVAIGYCCCGDYCRRISCGGDRSTRNTAGSTPAAEEGHAHPDPCAAPHPCACRRAQPCSMHSTYPPPPTSAFALQPQQHTRTIAGACEGCEQA